MSAARSCSKIRRQGRRIDGLPALNEFCDGTVGPVVDRTGDLLRQKKSTGLFVGAFVDRQGAGQGRAGLLGVNWPDRRGVSVGDSVMSPLPFGADETIGKRRQFGQHLDGGAGRFGCWAAAGGIASRRVGEGHSEEPPLRRRRLHRLVLPVKHLHRCDQSSGRVR